jgi:hypothetical protein
VIGDPIIIQLKVENSSAAECGCESSQEGEEIGSFEAEIYQLTATARFLVGFCKIKQPFLAVNCTYDFLSANFIP